MNCGAQVLSQEVYGPKKLHTVLGVFFYGNPDATLVVVKTILPHGGKTM